MSTLDVARTELALRVLYLNKAEARDKICRAIQYGSNVVSNGKPGTAQNVDKSTSLATKVFRLSSLSMICMLLSVQLLQELRFHLFYWGSRKMRQLSCSLTKLFGSTDQASTRCMHHFYLDFTKSPIVRKMV
ncbi:putative peroxisomal biogenesis factor 11 [Helianthus debilis subsp. tardiflorus]